MPKRDLLGQRFGKLTVVGENPERNKHRQVRWDCVCACGNEFTVTGFSLTAGHTKSCGCLINESAARVGKQNTTHGHSRQDNETPTYIKWCSMKSRCTNPNADPKGHYYHRGIKVCDRWLDSFENFLEDMGECPDGYSLERVDVNGDYCPENCIWIPFAKQSANRRNVKKLEHNGESLTIPEWSEKTGLSVETIRKRLELGWDVGTAIDAQVGTVKFSYAHQYEYNGKSQSLEDWSIELGINKGTLYTRIHELGWNLEKAFNTASDDRENKLEFNGKSQSVSAWARELRLDRKTIEYRLNKGLSVEECLTNPKNDGTKMLEYNGETLPMKEWAERFGFKRPTLARRLRQGWTIAQALHTPMGSKKPLDV